MEQSQQYQHGRELAGRTIFVIDDDDAVRDSLKIILEIWGYDVVTFPSGQLFLQRPTGLQGDCLIVDVHMPEMSGPELVRRLRAEGNAFPAIFITGRRDEALGEQARQMGAALFDKPVAHATLRRAIEDCLSPPDDRN